MGVIALFQGLSSEQNNPWINGMVLFCTSLDKIILPAVHMCTASRQLLECG